MARREPATAFKKGLIRNIAPSSVIPCDKQCSLFVVAIYAIGLFSSEHINYGMKYSGGIFNKIHIPT